MQWVMFLLVLTGQCFFSVCHLHEYHFININLTWERAQTYCRANYTDLASVFDKTDVQRMREKAEGLETDAWIGLCNYTERDNRTWHWSLPGIEYNQRESNINLYEPNNETENCVKMGNDLQDVNCNNTYKFVCYDEKTPGKKFHLIQDKMNWSQAQNYCRHNHTDLISGAQQLAEFEKERGSEYDLWIGLFRDTWRWSDRSNFSFRHWDKEPWSQDKQIGEKCATTLLKGGKWSFDNCNEQKPFFCYKSKLVLVQELKTWEQALYHCRDRHHDLVTISNPHQQGWVQETAKNATSELVWLGLRYTCALDLWFWISDQLVCYSKWAKEEQGQACDMAVAMKKKEQHEWVRKADTNKFSFICVER
ncbi:C-type mannose receptor 2-like [Parambassis ranga]|uniref:C-type mannose receptor 2-like n=1 Tax=Parambassis ranga TaxID=210632 RepID=A0A6P7I767_9TELE|nr:C-type mannose receptor 2-like [Parambassis ranga]